MRMSSIIGVRLSFFFRFFNSIVLSYWLELFLQSDHQKFFLSKMGFFVKNFCCTFDQSFFAAPWQRISPNSKKKCRKIFLKSPKLPICIDVNCCHFDHRATKFSTVTFNQHKFVSFPLDLWHGRTILYCKLACFFTRADATFGATFLFSQPPLVWIEVYQICHPGLEHFLAQIVTLLLTGHVKSPRLLEFLVNFYSYETNF